MRVERYQELVLAADVAERDEEGAVQSFDVRVFASPAGEGAPVRREVPQDLQRPLSRLDRRQLEPPAILGLGEALADLLLPAGARELLVRSLDRLAPGEGLRLRLRLPPELAGLPWEYLYVARAQGEKDATGFLALDPRLSIARHEALAVAAEADAGPRPRRLVAALSSPVADGYVPLDLDRERQVIESATAGVEGLRVDVLADVTAEGLADALAEGADLFHFAGHGVFEQSGLGVRPGSVAGHGSIVLQDAAGNPAHMAADQLAVNLRGRGVQLVVLGACETAKRDEEHLWSGVVAALMEAGIPAVVAMQYRVWDDAAIAFARALYRGLAAGLPLDQAVSLGRLQVFNLVHPRQDGLWREWGVPVLYLRTAGDMALPTIQDPAAQVAAADALTVVAELRVAEIGPHGTYVGVEAGAIKGGSIESHLAVGRSQGQATLVEAEKVSGGEIRSTAEVDRLEAGKITGVRVGSLGGRPPTSPATPATANDDATVAGAPTARACTHCGANLAAGSKFCSNCGTAAPAGPRFCTQCGAELASATRFCGQCGAAAGLAG